MSEPSIYVIPAEYYGGAAPKKRSSPVSAAQQGGSISSARKPRAISSGKTFFIVVGILFIVVIGGSVWYFTRSASVPVPSVPSPEPVVAPPPAVVPPVTSVVPPPPVSPPTEPETPTAEIAPASDGLALSEDPDRDGLTEAEEVVYGTKSTLPDTDGDGYLDGHEVTNLYNPSGVAPQKLEQAGLAVSYASSQLGFDILYPRTWRANSENGDRNIVFQATDGESISLTFVDNLTQASFEDWLKVQEPNVTLVPWTENKQGRRGFKAGEVAIYLEGAGSRVAVLRYNPIVPEAVRYRATLSMMADSFSVHP